MIGLTLTLLMLRVLLPYWRIGNPAGKSLRGTEG